MLAANRCARERFHSFTLQSVAEPLKTRADGMEEYAMKKDREKEATANTRSAERR